MTETEITTQTFRPEPNAYIRFAAVSYFRSLINWRTAALYAALIIGWSVMTNLQAVLAGRFSNILPKVGWLVGLIVILGPFVSAVYVAWNFKRAPLLSSERSVRLSDRSLVVEGSGLFNELTWNNFYAAEGRKRHFLLHMSAHQALIIPISAFESAEQADAFLRRAQHLIAQSRYDQAAVFDMPVTPAPAPAKLQSLPYVYTFWLHLRLRTSLYLRSPWPKLALGLIAIAWIIGWPMSRNLPEAGQAAAVSLMTSFSISIAALYSVFPLAYTALLWLLSRPHASRVGPCIATLIGDHLVIHGQSYHCEFLLGEFKRVWRTPGLMVFALKSGPAEAIPLSAFASTETADAFFDEAFSLWRAARPAPAAKTHLDGKS
ncbi:YcxB family protein [Asticcacaulis sp. AC402]|uniref:YcxB family protein n=1 Tax=Asticcacaulis sp. AC402 TaxID=1282361 RepID=UPI0003C4116A|nr:YcxB family protein [Asticcacaulis sp. AC402]ESQ77765.1 hypothetical protein ABAC402_01125 [Asticcacaulis sp. AC402]